MLTRLRNIWRPENFHYAHRLGRVSDRKAEGRAASRKRRRRAQRGGAERSRTAGRAKSERFEGWYFKIVDREGRHPFAIIPGVFLGAGAHAFVQVLDGRRGASGYHRFPLSEFEASSDEFDVRIADNRFRTSELSLNLGSLENSSAPALRGRLEIGAWSRWPVTLLSPGVMGPYSFAPLMQCNHGILSLDHPLSGALESGEGTLAFDGGRGYLEKDWGKSFPLGYVWTQSNHFDREGIGVTASLATVPWITGAFRGFLVGFLLDGTLHRFTTYTGARVESLTMSDTHLSLCVADATHRLEVDSRKSEGAILHAPYERQMLERVAETMTSEIELRFHRREGGLERLVYQGTGRHACLEAQGDLHRILDDVERSS